MSALNENQYLLNYRNNVTSQFGEDGIIEKIFEIISEKDKWCVEFGAWDGKHFSNTWNLLNNKDYAGVLVEANKIKFKELKDNYKHLDRVFCLNEFVNFEGENSLDNILSKTEIPINFDFISIDIDGNDYHIWDSLKKYKPKVVLIEFNSFIPDEVSFIQKRDLNVMHGNSLLALVNLGKAKGYELVCINQENAFFVLEEYFPSFNIKDNSIRALKHFRHPLHIFQLYDGTIVVEGAEALYYYGMAVDLNKKVQVLPKYLRDRHLPWNNYKMNLFEKIMFRIYKRRNENKKITNDIHHKYIWGWKEKYDSLL